MIITKEQHDKIQPIVERINRIMDLEDASWEDKYNAIFSKELSRVFFDTFPSFDYYDPDTSYQEDVCEFVWAVNSFWKDIHIV